MNWSKINRRNTVWGRKVRKENHEAPWKDNRSLRVSNIDEAAAFCANVNFNRPSNSPSFDCAAASAASLAIPIRAYDCPEKIYNYNTLYMCKTIVKIINKKLYYGENILFYLYLFLVIIALHIYNNTLYMCKTMVKIINKKLHYGENILFYLYFFLVIIALHKYKIDSVV